MRDVHDAFPIITRTFREHNRQTEESRIFDKENRMRIAIQTLGCKVNQYETQAMEEILTKRGHILVPFEEEADAYIINSCTVTAVSDKKSRQAVRQARRRRPGAVVALCGCYPQVAPGEAEKLKVDLIGGSGNREQFLSLLEAAWETRKPITAIDDAMGRRVFEVLPAGGLEGRTRALLKVEDGCVNFCAYCIIPYARGPVRSLPLKRAEEEARRLAVEGYRELVITGIEISSYGRDLEEKPALTDLVESVCQAAPELRVRLGSLEPRTVTEEFCARLARLPNLCPHFHLSLQSGCDETLRRMNRRYDTARYRESVELLRKWFDDPGLTTDLIVGFPGETEGEFEKTCGFLRLCGFSAMHVFPYSGRKGTPAASLPGQVPNAVKADRAGRAAALADEMTGNWLERQVGKTETVLFEEERDGFWRGHTPRYAEVRAPGENLHNRLCPVTVTAAGDGVLWGRRTGKGEKP